MQENKTLEEVTGEWIRASDSDPRLIKRASEEDIIQDLKIQANGGHFGYSYHGFGLTAITVTSLATLKEKSLFVSPMMGYLSFILPASQDEMYLDGILARYEICKNLAIEEKILFLHGQGITEENRSVKKGGKTTIEPRAKVLRELIEPVYRAAKRYKKFDSLSKHIHELNAYLKRN